MGRMKLDQAEERNVNGWPIVPWMETVVITTVAA